MLSIIGFHYRNVNGKYPVDFTIKIRYKQCPQVVLDDSNQYGYQEHQKTHFQASIVISDTKTTRNKLDEILKGKDFFLSYFI